MPRQPSGNAVTGPQPAGSSPGGVVLGAIAVVLLAAGWFALSWRVGHNTAQDAFGEALGVGLGLLIVASVVGAIFSRDTSDADQSDDD